MFSKRRPFKKKSKNMKVVLKKRYGPTKEVKN